MKFIPRRNDIPVLLLYDIDPIWGSTDKANVIDAAEMLKSKLQEEGHPVTDVAVEAGDALTELLKPFDPDQYIVFNWCEALPGTPRSDYQVANILERLCFAYTGSTPQILASNWDKAATKHLLDRHDIPTPCWRVVDNEDVSDWELFPAIVKPAAEHCSNGITRDAVVLNSQELKERITFVRGAFNQPALIEDFIDGREFHVTIWGNGTINALPPAEMDFSAFSSVRDRLCTFDSKFTPGSTHYEKIEVKVPALLDETQSSALNQVAIKAYKVMGCRDYARIDLRLGRGHYQVLDINPNADFSPDTSMVYAAEAAGFSYGVFASWMINLAAQRHPKFSVS